MKIPHLMAAIALCAMPVAYSQNPVYELPGETGGLFTYLPIPLGTEYADSASLAGTDRFLEEATLNFYSNIARTGSLTFSIYGIVPEDIDYGPTGQPGVTPGALADFKPNTTPLWTSGPTTVTFTGGGATGLNLDQVVFSGINTLVPDDLYWSIKIESLSNYNGTGFGPKLENAADLGPSGAETDGSRFYVRAPGGDWSPQWLNQQPAPTSTLSLQLTASAVPEPSVALLSFVGSLALLRRRRAA